MSTALALNATELSCEELAVVVNREHSACAGRVERVREIQRDALRHAWLAGDALLMVKAQLRHGEFKPWLTENIEASYSSARDYMRIRRMYPSPEALPSLPLNTARLGRTGPERRRRQQVAARRRSRERRALRRQEATRAARARGDDLAEAYSLVRRTAQRLERAERTVEGDARAAIRRAQLAIYRAEEDLICALGVV